ncbi:hypothetical protein ACWEKM_32640 [Streptomyces sp. NPDC004752]
MAESPHPVLTGRPEWVALADHRAEVDGLAPSTSALVAGYRTLKNV